MNIDDFKPNTKKQCTTCKEWKQIDDFSPHTTSVDKIHPHCKKCRNKAQRRKYRRKELREKELEINELVIAKPRPPRKKYRGPKAKAWAGPTTTSECKIYTAEEIKEINNVRRHQ